MKLTRRFTTSLLIVSVMVIAIMFVAILGASANPVSVAAAEPEASPEAANLIKATYGSMSKTMYANDLNSAFSVADNNVTIVMQNDYDDEVGFRAYDKDLKKYVIAHLDSFELYNDAEYTDLDSTVVNSGNTNWLHDKPYTYTLDLAGHTVNLRKHSLELAGDVDCKLIITDSVGGGIIMYTPYEVDEVSQELVIKNATAQKLVLAPEDNKPMRFSHNLPYPVFNSNEYYLSNMSSDVPGTMEYYEVRAGKVFLYNYSQSRYHGYGRLFDASYDAKNEGDELRMIVDIIEFETAQSVAKDKSIVLNLINSDKSDAPCTFKSDIVIDTGATLVLQNGKYTAEHGDAIAYVPDHIASIIGNITNKGSLTIDNYGIKISGAITDLTDGTNTVLNKGIYEGVITCNNDPEAETPVYPVKVGGIFKANGLVHYSYFDYKNNHMLLRAYADPAEAYYLDYYSLYEGATIAYNVNTDASYAWLRRDVYCDGAIDEVDVNETIALLADQQDVIIPVNNNIGDVEMIFDLNGFTVSDSDDIDEYAFENYATVTIKDSKVAPSGATTGAFTGIVLNNTAMTIEGGIFNANVEDTSPFGTIVITGGIYMDTCVIESANAIPAENVPFISGSAIFEINNVNYEYYDYESKHLEKIDSVVAKIYAAYVATFNETAAEEDKITGELSPEQKAAAFGVVIPEEEEAKAAALAVFEAKLAYIEGIKDYYILNSGATMAYNTTSLFGYGTAKEAFDDVADGEIVRFLINVDEDVVVDADKNSEFIIDLNEKTLKALIVEGSGRAVSVTSIAGEGSIGTVTVKNGGALLLGEDVSGMGGANVKVTGNITVLEGDVTDPEHPVKTGLVIAKGTYAGTIDSQGQFAVVVINGGIFTYDEKNEDGSYKPVFTSSFGTFENEGFKVNAGTFAANNVKYYLYDYALMGLYEAATPLEFTAEPVTAYNVTTDYGYIVVKNAFEAAVANDIVRLIANVGGVEVPASISAPVVFDLNGKFVENIVVDAEAEVLVTNMAGTESIISGDFINNGKLTLGYMFEDKVAALKLEYLTDNELLEAEELNVEQLAAQAAYVKAAFNAAELTDEEFAALLFSYGEGVKVNTSIIDASEIVVDEKTVSGLKILNGVYEIDGVTNKIESAKGYGFITGGFFKTNKVQYKYYDFTEYTFEQILSAENPYYENHPGYYYLKKAPAAAYSYDGVTYTAYDSVADAIAADDAILVGLLADAGAVTINVATLDFEFYNNNYNVTDITVHYGSTIILGGIDDAFRGVYEALGKTIGNGKVGGVKNQGNLTITGGTYGKVIIVDGETEIVYDGAIVSSDLSELETCSLTIEDGVFESTVTFNGADGAFFSVNGGFFEYAEKDGHYKPVFSMANPAEVVTGGYFKANNVPYPYYDVNIVALILNNESGTAGYGYYVLTVDAGVVWSEAVIVDLYGYYTIEEAIAATAVTVIGEETTLDQVDVINVALDRSLVIEARNGQGDVNFILNLKDKALTNVTVDSGVVETIVEEEVQEETHYATVEIINAIIRGVITDNGVLSLDNVTFTYHDTDDYGNYNNVILKADDAEEIVFGEVYFQANNLNYTYYNNAGTHLQVLGSVLESKYNAYCDAQDVLLVADMTIEDKLAALGLDVGSDENKAYIGRMETRLGYYVFADGASVAYNVNTEYAYGTTDEAFAAVRKSKVGDEVVNQTVKLLTNVDAVTIEVPTYEFTFDLNEKTIGTEVEGATAVTVKYGTDVTIQNGTVLNEVKNYGEVMIVSGTFGGNIFNYNRMRIVGGVFNESVKNYSDGGINGVMHIRGGLFNEAVVNTAHTFMDIKATETTMPVFENVVINDNDMAYDFMVYNGIFNYDEAVDGKYLPVIVSPTHEFVTGGFFKVNNLKANYYDMNAYHLELVIDNTDDKFAAYVEAYNADKEDDQKITVDALTAADKAAALGLANVIDDLDTKIATYVTNYNLDKDEEDKITVDDFKSWDALTQAQALDVSAAEVDAYVRYFKAYDGYYTLMEEGAVAYIVVDEFTNYAYGALTNETKDGAFDVALSGDKIVLLHAMGDVTVIAKNANGALDIIFDLDGYAIDNLVIENLVEEEVVTAFATVALENGVVQGTVTDNGDLTVRNVRFTYQEADETGYKQLITKGEDADLDLGSFVDLENVGNIFKVNNVKRDLYEGRMITISDKIAERNLAYAEANDLNIASFADWPVHHKIEALNLFEGVQTAYEMYAAYIMKDVDLLDDADKNTALADAGIVMLYNEFIDSIAAIEDYYIIDNTAAVAYNVETDFAYATTKEAFTAVKAGQTVKLLTDVADVTVNATPEFIFDLNGNDVTGIFTVTETGNVLVTTDGVNESTINIVENLGKLTLGYMYEDKAEEILASKIAAYIEENSTEEAPITEGDIDEDTMAELEAAAVAEYEEQYIPMGAKLTIGTAVADSSAIVDGDATVSGLKILNGYYNNEILDSIHSVNGKEFIKGGIFAKNVRYEYYTYSTSHMIQIEEGDYEGKWTLAEGKTHAYIANTSIYKEYGYETLDDALAVAIDADTIVLLFDVTDNDGLTLAIGNLNLNLNNNILAVSKLAIKASGIKICNGKLALATEVTAPVENAATLPIEISVNDTLDLNLTTDNRLEITGTGALHDLSDKYGKVTISGGEYNADIVTKGNANLTIEDGVFEGTLVAYDDSAIVIKGGDFYSRVDSLMLEAEYVAYNHGDDGDGRFTVGTKADFAAAVLDDPTIGIVAGKSASLGSFYDGDKALFKPGYFPFLIDGYYYVLSPEEYARYLFGLIEDHKKDLETTYVYNDNGLATLKRILDKAALRKADGKLFLEDTNTLFWAYLAEIQTYLDAEDYDTVTDLLSNLDAVYNTAIKEMDEVATINIDNMNLEAMKADALDKLRVYATLLGITFNDGNLTDAKAAISEAATIAEVREALDAAYVAVDETLAAYKAAADEAAAEQAALAEAAALAAEKIAAIEAYNNYAALVLDAETEDFTADDKAAFDEENIAAINAATNVAAVRAAYNAAIAAVDAKLAAAKNATIAAIEAIEEGDYMTTSMYTAANTAYTLSQLNKVAAIAQAEIENLIARLEAEAATLETLLGLDVDETVKSEIEAAIEAIEAAITTSQGVITGSVSDAQTAITTAITTLTNTMNAKFEALTTLIGTTDTHLVTELTAAQTALNTAIGNAKTATVSEVGTAITAAQTAITDAITAVTTNVNAKYDLLINAINGLDEDLAGKLADAQEALEDAIGGSEEAVIDAIATAQGVITDAITAVTTNVNAKYDLLINAINGLDEDLAGKLTAAKEALEGAIAESDEAVIAEIGNAQGVITDAITALTNSINGKYEVIIAAFSGLDNDLTEKLTAAKNALNDAIEKDTTDTIAALNEANAGLANALTEVKSELVKLLASTTDLAKKMGVENDETLKALIENARVKVGEAVAALDDALLNKDTGAIATQTKDLKLSVNEANDSIKAVDTYLNESLEPKVDGNSVISDVVLGIICGTFVLAVLILVFVLLKRKKNA